MTNSLQKMTLSMLPSSMAKKAERESKNWIARCDCGHERSIWDLGGVRYKASGSPRRMIKCPECKRFSWHRITYQPPELIQAELVAESGDEESSAKSENASNGRRSILAATVGAAFRVLSLVSLILTLVGTSFVGVAAIFFLGLASLGNSAATTTGTVVELEHGRSVRPVVVYTVSNSNYRVEGRVAMSPSPYEVGDQVAVLYQPRHPEQARIDDWVERGGPFACIGSILGLVGSTGLFLLWRHRRKR